MTGMIGKISKKLGLTGAFAAAALAFPLTGGDAPFFGNVAHAQQIAPEGSQADCIANTCLAYIITGNAAVDNMTEAGLLGLSQQLYDRTTVENFYVTEGQAGVNSNQASSGPVLVVGVDPAVDDLSLYPMVYWSIDPGQAAFSDRATENLNQYMTDGGMLFIDTRDESTFNRGRRILQRAVEDGLEIPTLRLAEGCESAQNECDVISKSFFLLESFPGRYVGSGLWVEDIDGEYNHDGVSRVLIGGNEWVGAWAVDSSGNALLPVIGSDPEQREYAFRVGINLVMYALTGHYKGDQVHIPAILERMGRDPGLEP